MTTTQTKHEEIACQINLCAAAHAHATQVSEMIQSLGPKVIVFAMKELGVTQAGLARRCKLSRCYISRLASGECKCSIEFAATISEVVAQAWSESRSPGSVVGK